MSVVGSLEDLSFPDVLQIVRASRRSGTLRLDMRDGERRVRFENGVIRDAMLGPGGPALDDLLQRQGSVGAQAVAGARARAARTGTSVISALVAMGSVAQETIDRLVREELKASLRSLVLSQEGEFRFELEDERVPGERALLLIERSVLRRAVEDELERGGFAVDTCETPGQVLERARRLLREGAAFLLVTDLVLPDAGGKGWRGGLDLVRSIRSFAPKARGLLLGEIQEANMDAEARAAGACAYLTSPDLGGARLADVGSILARFGAQVRETLLHPEDVGAGPPRPVRAVDHLSLLRNLVGELHAEEEIEIPLLVLRLAAEYFERGVLFVVRDNRAHGTGAFGGETDDPDPEGLDGRVRGVELSLLPGSILETACRTRVPYVGPIEPTDANAPLIEKLGTPLPKEAAIIPVCAGRQVFAILYGDNGSSARPLGDLRGLEIFVAQAGIALRNVSLQRRLSELSQAGGTKGPDA
ncbi:MAG: hypothetical protein AUI47_05095 [Acidobacteria bacterium 13_1_40CM_2_68_5]|nr:MAG: hypothetical protein AUI47_05095 [Acidobacteria bacterium 13_1_40CM_2_68_5]